MEYFRGFRNFAEIATEGGPRRGVVMSVRQWDRAVICERTILGIGWFHEGKAIARLLGIKGMISINPFSDYKGCFFV